MSLDVELTENLIRVPRVPVNENCRNMHAGASICTSKHSTARIFPDELLSTGLQPANLMYIRCTLHIIDSTAILIKLQIKF